MEGIETQVGPRVKKKETWEGIGKKRKIIYKRAGEGGQRVGRGDLLV